MLKRNCWIAVILILALFSIGTSQTERWVYRYNGPGYGGDIANSLVYGADGNIYVAGWGYGSDTTYDFTVISLTSTGTERWVYRYNGPANESWDYAYSLVYGADGNIYIAGYSVGSGTFYDFTVISLSSTGAQRWVYQYNGPGNGWDEAYSLVYGADGNVYAAGFSYGSGSTYYGFTVISLNPAIVGIEEETAIRSPLLYVRCFGNTIEFSTTLSKPTNIPISIYNIAGEKVYLFTINASAGISHHQKELSFLPQGVYVVKAEMEQRNINKKFVVMK
jgi:hypothetical protein